MAPAYPITVESDRGPRILLVEDDAELASDVSSYLSDNGYRVQTVRRGDEAVVRVLEDAPDLVLLDVLLPGLDGLGVCRKIRPAYRGPVLMLTALGDDVDQIVGLEVGADDYLVKPVHPRVLLARIRTALRRMTPNDAEREVPAAIAVGDLAVDPASRSARLRGRELELTTFEFDLLVTLAQRAGLVVSRQDLSLEVRGVPYDGIDRTIDLGVSRLRAKLGDDAKRPSLLKSVRGMGYLLARSG